MMFLDIFGIGDAITTFVLSIPYYARKLLRIIVSLLDGVIYTVDAELYDLIVKIANTNIIKDSTINEIAGRVYQLLALIMIFRIIFVSITYIMNPEAMLDKAKGYGNIVKKIIITLGLIIVVPWGFRELRNIQAVVLDDKVIEYFVFGTSNRTMTSAGYTFMQTVGKQFIQPYKCREDTCKDFCIRAANEQNKTDPDDVMELCDGVTDHRNNYVCEGDWEKNLPIIDNMGFVSGTTNDSCGYGLGNDYEYAQDMYKGTVPHGGKYDLIALMRTSTYAQAYTATQGWKADFYTDYKIPFVGSTLVGVAIGYMLIIICIDIAVRSVKLSFFEMIAPIPIVSYIGFKDGKETMLSKWFNMVMKTYALLFVRLAGLEIAFLFLEEMVESGFNTGGNIFVALFLILGVLTFAKQVPQLIKDLGINFEGGGFNLKKKLQPIAPVTGALAGGLGGMLGNYNSARAAGRGVFRSLNAAARGFNSGTVKGLAAGAKDKDGFGVNSALAAAGKSGQRIMAKKGTSFVGRNVARLQQSLNMETAHDKNQKRFKTEDEWMNARKSMYDEATDYMTKNPMDASVQITAADGVTYVNHAGATMTASGNAMIAAAELERMKTTGKDSSGRRVNSEDIMDQEIMVAALKKKAQEKIIDARLASNDAKFQAKLAEMNALEKKMKRSQTSTVSDMDSVKAAIEGSIPDRYSRKVVRAEKNASYNPPKK